MKRFEPDHYKLAAKETGAARNVTIPAELQEELQTAVERQQNRETQRA